MPFTPKYLRCQSNPVLFFLITYDRTNHFFVHSNFRKEEIGRIIQEVMDETAEDDSGEEDEEEEEESEEEDYAAKKNGKAKVCTPYFCRITYLFCQLFFFEKWRPKFNAISKFCRKPPWGLLTEFS